MAMTSSSKTDSVFGDKAVIIADVAFDSSYPTGGESIDTDALFGMHYVNFATIEPASGYSFQYDYANDKIKAYAPAPAIIYDETHAIDPSTGGITLDYPAAFIQNVCMTGGQNLKLRSTGLAVSSMSGGQCCLTSQMAAGVRTQLTCATSTDPDLLAASNGGFTGNANGWTLGLGWAYNSNTAVKTAGNAGTLSHDSFTPVVGKTYKITVSFSAFTAGKLVVSLGGDTGDDITTDSTYTGYFTATATTGLVLTPNSDCACVINTVYITLMEAKVSYVTQAWKDVWDNLVQDEVITLASGGAVDSDYEIAALMYVDQTSTTAAGLTIIDEDDTAASGEVAVYFGQTTGTFKASHADQNGKSCKVTYIKKPSSGFLYDRAVDNETATADGSDPYTHTFDYPILLWGYAGCVPFNTGTTQVLIDYASTPAAGEAVLDWFTPGARGAGAPAAGSVIGVKSNLGAGVTGAYIWGTIQEIQNLQPLEVKDGTDLSGLTIRIFLIGT